MKALSLWEPWASAMRLGVKHNETRSWPTAYRGDLVICASKRKMTEEELDTLYIIIPNTDDLDRDYPMPYGKALCVVELFDCAQAAAFLSGMLAASETEMSLGNYTYGRFIWRTRNLRPLKEPVPVLGRQGLWILTPEEEKAVREQL